MADRNTRIKICGLRRTEDIDAVNLYHPDYAGFICSSRFWRFIPRQTLVQLHERLAEDIPSVGVFVDESAEYIAKYVEDGLIDIVQLHGHEDNAYINALKSSVSVPVIKAYKIETEQDIQTAKQSSADCILLDNGTGTGRTFDWSLIRDIGRPYFLAGGLRTENLKEALDSFHPFGVDISGGVETDRLKDPEKIRRVINIVRNN